MMIGDLRRVAAFGDDCNRLWGTGYPEALLERISHVLRDKNTTHEDTYAIYYVLTALVYCNLTPFAEITMPEGTGLVPTLLTGWQRQRCQAPDKLTRKFYVTLHIIE